MGSCAPETAAARLARELWDGDPDEPMAREIATWLASSRRFRAFTDAHRDKIHKKLRSATDAEALRDVRAELRVAQLLLDDRRIELAFEAYGSGRAGPDFTITYRARQTMNVEVTRLRAGPSTTSFIGAVLTKVRQLPPSVPNALVVAVEGADARELDVVDGIRSLRARADAKDEDFFARRGFANARGFYERFLRLGVVIAWSEAGTSAESRATSWTNGSARIPVPQPALSACVTRLGAG